MSRARRGEGTWEPRGSGGRLRVMAGRDADGRRQYLDFTAPTEAEARQQYDQWKIERGIRGYAPPVDRWRATFAEYLPVFYEELDRLVAVGKMQVRTREFYRDNLERFARPVLGHLKVRELRVDDLHRVYAVAQKEAAKSKRSTGGVRAAKAAQQALSRCLAYAERCDYAARNVARLADNPEYKSPKRQPPTADNLKAIRVKCDADGDPLTAWWEIAFHGLRPGEMLGLTWPRVDLDGRYLDVVEARDTRRKTGDPKPPKSEAGLRRIPLTDRAVALLRAHRDAQAFRCRRAGERWQDNDLVFCNTRGEPASYRAIGKRWEKLREAVGLPEGTRPYDLRHAYVSEMLAEGTPLQDVSWLAGHADPYFTARTYGHLLERQRDEHRERLERALGGS